MINYRNLILFLKSELGFLMELEALIQQTMKRMNLRSNTHSNLIYFQAGVRNFCSLEAYLIGVFYLYFNFHVFFNPNRGLIILFTYFLVDFSSKNHVTFNPQTLNLFGGSSEQTNLDGFRKIFRSISCVLFESSISTDIFFQVDNNRLLCKLHFGNASAYKQFTLSPCNSQVSKFLLGTWECHKEIYIQ